MTRLGRHGPIATAAWAVAGVLGGHVATYGILFPDAAVHHAQLESTGHAWMGLAGPVLLMALVTFVVAAALAARGSAGRRIRFSVLAVVQVGIFVAIELGERFAVGMPADLLAHELFDHGLATILVLGTAIQLAVAWLGSAAARLVERIVGSRQPTAPRLPRALSHRLAPGIPPVISTHSSATPIRGPPARAIAASMV
jgi:hypothetical protein